jgi:hypothetical protein
LLLAGAGFGALGTPQAAHAAGPSDEIAHIVQPGDTLEGLAQSYFAAPQLWPRLQARNKVKDPKHLQPGSVVWIPVQLQPAETARVEFVHGQVTAQAAGDGKATPAPAPLTTGATLAEGTQLEVGPDAFVAVRLADGSIVRVSAQSQVQLQQLRRRGRAGSVQSVLEVQRGSVESTVTPSGDASRRFEVRTPRAVTSVRGTRFGVALTEGGQTTAAVLQGAQWLCSHARLPLQPLVPLPPLPPHPPRSAPGPTPYCTPAKAWPCKPTAPWAAPASCCQRQTFPPCHRRCTSPACWHWTYPHSQLPLPTKCSSPAMQT